MIEFLGQDVSEKEINAVLSKEARFQGTYIIGRPGMGKSTLLTWMMEQDSDFERGFCLLDPHGDIFDEVAAMAQEHGRETVLLDASDTEYPFGINIFDCQNHTDPIARTMTVTHALGVFRKLWGDSEGAWGLRLETLLRAIAVLLVDNPGMTLCEVPLLLYQDDYRAMLMENLRDDQVRWWWENEYDKMSQRERRDFRASTINRVSALVANPIVRNIVGQSGTTVDIERVMSKQMILLVKLPVGIIGEDAVSLLGSTIVRDVLQATMARARTRDRTPFFLYADEYHRFATPDFATLIEEARKYHVGVTIAHQRRAQLDSRHRSSPLSSVNLICFEVQGADAGELALEFDATPPPRQIVGYRGVPRMASRPFDYMRSNAAPTEKIQNVVRAMDRHLISHHEHQFVMSRYGFFSDPGFRAHVYQEDNQMLVNIINERSHELMVTSKLDKDTFDAEVEKSLRLIEVRGGFSEELCKDRRYQGADDMAVYAYNMTLLGFLLNRNPVRTLSGDQEPIYEPEMTVANVRDKIANDLSQLGPHRAMVHLHGYDKPTDFLIEPLLPFDYPDDYTRLKEISRIEYGRPAGQVGSEIAARATLTSPVESTIEHSEPARRSVKIRRRTPL